MITTAVFDLETSDLSGDRAIILCGVIQSSTQRKPIIIRTDDTNPGWSKGKRSNDSETVKQIVQALNGHDILVAHNGKRFDLPMLRTRLAHWGLPPLPTFKLVDPLKLAWDYLRLQRNSLGSLQDHFGIADRKTPLEWSNWMRATLDGDRAAMDKIVEHCIADVKVLAGVLDIVKPYAKILDDRGSSR